MRQLGFADVAEVAIGADLCTIDEAKDFMRRGSGQDQPFMGTSCCPAWSVMAKKLFPEQAECISMAMTPMVLTARLLKNEQAEARSSSSSAPAPPRSWRPAAAPSAVTSTSC